jgi:hypothetical protein
MFLFKQLESDILYEHEMERPETQEGRTTRLVANIISIFILIILIIIMYLFILPIPGALGAKIAAIIYLILNGYFFVYNGIKYNLKIKLAITNNKLLVCAPSQGYMTFPGFHKLKIPLANILEVSVRNLKSPELKAVLRETGFKVPINQKLYFRRYQYILSLKTQTLPYNVQFLDIKLSYGRHILIDYDDIDTFLDALRKLGIKTNPLYDITPAWKE